MFRWICAILVTSKLSAASILCGHTVGAGPETYMSTRHRASSEQDGIMTGVAAFYERYVCQGLYWGFDGHYAWGDLEGTTRRSAPLHSHLFDSKSEGRIGYTFSLPRNLSVTPFSGYGYFSESNRFRPPSPIVVTFRTDYTYTPVGLLMRYHLTPTTWIGFDFKTEFVLNIQSHVTDDPQYPDITLMVNPKNQYTFEVPLNLQPCRWVGIRMVPFWWTRHFGGRTNFPFDFFETHVRMLGFRIEVTAGF